MSDQGLRLLTLASGSTGNCFAVAYRDEVLLVDAGLSRKRTLAALDAAGLGGATVRGLVLTHEHSDHVQGAGPVARGLKIPVHASEGTLRAAAPRLGRLPEAHGHRGAVPFKVGPFQVLPFPTFHDARDPFAMVIEGPDGARVGVVTDLGAVTGLAEERLRGVEALILEANHDEDMLRRGPYPWSLKQRILSRAGHLPNQAAAALARRLADHGLRRVLASHLSQTNNSPARVREAFRRVEAAGVEVHLSAPDGPSPILAVGAPARPPPLEADARPADASS